MQIHQLKSKKGTRRGQRVGRGGKRGTTSGRGTKGQKARAGHKIRPALRDVIKKLPKRRGYRFRPFQVKPVILNLAKIAEYFANGEQINPEVLLKKNLVRKIKGKMPRIKILARGEAGDKKFVFKDVELSRSAAEKVNPAPFRRAVDPAEKNGVSLRKPLGKSAGRSKGAG